MDIFLEYLSTAGAVIFVFVALGFCIFSHELGHFLAGKLMGLHIDAFSIGFRPVWRKKYKGVEYRIGWLPLGGYVELPQVDASDDIPKSADGTELPPATPAARIVTAVAGPLFNIISGLLLGCIVWAVGVPEATPKMREITVLSVPESSPEYLAGLRPGDVIVKLNGEKFFFTWEKFVEKVLFTINEVTLDVRRNDQELKISYVPAENPDAPGKAGKEKLAYPFFKPLIPIKLYPAADSPAARAGIKDGDIVSAIDGEAVSGIENFTSAINFSNGKELTFEVLRNGEKLLVKVTPRPIEKLADQERFLTGIVMELKNSRVRIASLMAGGAAAGSGLQKGDIIAAVDQTPVKNLQDLPEYIHKTKLKELTLTVIRQDKELYFKVTPRRFAPHEIGVAFAAYNHPNPLELFWNTIDMSWKSLRGIATTIGNKLHLTDSRSSLKPSHMSSTLGIGMALYDSIRTSPAYGLYLMVVISFALAIFNLLPLPVLDGGHILFGLLEMLTGKRIPGNVMKVISYIFITLLILLTIWITYYDGKRMVNKFTDQTQVKSNAADNP